MIENEVGYQSYIKQSKGDKTKNENRFEQIDFKGQKVYLWKGWGDGIHDNITPFIECVNAVDWGITIKRV